MITIRPLGHAVAGLATLVSVAAGNRVHDELSARVFFRPGNIVCERTPCPGSRPSVVASNLMPPWFTLSDSALALDGKVYRRDNLYRIDLRGQVQGPEHGEPVPPEDMVTWTGGSRTFGPVRVNAGSVLQPGRAPRALPEALQIAFGSPRAERITPVVLRIGELKQNATSVGAPVYEHWNCSVELSRDAADELKRRKRNLPLAPAQAGTSGAVVYWAEFLASRREGRRYGPDRQKLCQFDVTRLLALRQRAPSQVKPHP